MDERFFTALGALQDFFASNGNDPMRGIQGKFGPQTPESRAGRTPASYGDLRGYVRPGADSFEQRQAQSLNSAATLAGIPQAGVAVGTAIDDPTLGHITDAGAKTAMALMQPAKAVGILGAGFGAAAAQDLGLFGGSSANAQAGGQDPLDPGSRARLQQLQKKVQTGGTLSRAEREEQNSYLSTLTNAASETAKAGAATRAAAERAAIEADAQKKSSDLAEYNNAVKRAEDARNAELARVRRFSGTRMGQVYNDVGGAPALAMTFAGGAGLLDRLAKGAPKTGWDYARLGAEGTGAAVAGNNFALGYDAFATDPDNPEKAAYSAYARELPVSHPRKQEFADYAAGLPSANPIRAAAQNELYDPLKLAERTGMSLIEGVPTAWTAANIPSALKNSARGAASLPGAMTEGYQSGMANASVARGVRQLEDEAFLQQTRQLQLEKAAQQSRGQQTGQVVDGAALSGPVPQQNALLGPTQQGQLPPPVPPGNSLTAPVQAQMPTQGGTATLPGQQGFSSPYPPNVQQLLDQTTQGDKWAKLHSTDARNALLSALDDGKNLSAKRGKMGDPMSITPNDIGVGTDSTTRKQLGLLRDVLAHRGIDLSKLSRAQVENALRTIDPRIFAIPGLAVGAGAASQSPNALYGDQ